MDVVSTYIITVATLYLPGFLFFRILGSSLLQRLVLAPIFSLCGYLSVPIALLALGVAASGWVIFLVVLSLGVVAFAASFFLQKGSKLPSTLDALFPSFKRCDWLVIGAYVAVSSLFMLLLFAQGFSDASQFNQQFDNYTHLRLVQSYVDAGQFSALRPLSSSYTTPYFGSAPVSYPAMWHVLCAIIASEAHTAAPVAANVLNYVICSIVFPTGIFLFLKLVAKRGKTVIAGSVVATAFTAFPAGFVDWGPLSPNLLAFALVPSLVSLWIAASAPKRQASTRATAIVLFCCLFAVLALAHPNAVFFAGIIIVPFICHRISSAEVFPNHGKPFRVMLKAALIAVLLGAFAAVWMLLCSAPFMQGVMAGEWEAFSTRKEALIDLLTFGMTERVAAQPIMGFIVGVGLIRACLDKKTAWLILPFLFTCFLYLGGVPSSGTTRHILIGFWYTDPYRIAAMVSITAIPLAALGLSAFYELADWTLKKIRLRCASAASNVFAVALSLLFMAICYYPLYLPDHDDPNSAFGSLVNDIRKQSALYYTPEEQSFVEKATQIIDPEKIVLNDPYDGSGYLYGADGVKVAIPTYLEYQGDDTDGIAALTRRGLSSYASNDEILKTLREANVGYLLLLDVPQEGSDLSREWNASDPQGFDDMLSSKTIKGWEGYYNINDTTPGFELVLSEGDMRLYKLTDV